MNNFYPQAKFLLSSPSLAGCPKDEGYEVIFTGRSNAGKSSAINALTLQKKLAKVSRTPGRTRHLVFFEIDKNRRLVDLPGYGYAKVPSHIRGKWHTFINKYFNKRRCLKGAILVMDCRRPLQIFEKMILNWCVDSGIPLHILLTKADKLKKIAATNAHLKIKRELEGYNVSVQLFSSLKKQGLDEVWEKLDQFFKINTDAD